MAKHSGLFAAGQVFTIGKRYCMGGMFESDECSGTTVVLQRPMGESGDWYCSSDMAVGADWTLIVHESRLADSRYQGRLYAVTRTHRISKIDADDVPVLQVLDDGCFSDRLTLGRELRENGLMGSGSQLVGFRVQGDKVLCFPDKRTGWHCLTLTSIY